MMRRDVPLRTPRSTTAGRRSVLEAPVKPPFVGPNGSAAARRVTGSAMREELVGIPPRERQFAKRCRAHTETLAWPPGKSRKRKARQPLYWDPP